MKTTKFFLAALIATLLLASCGSGSPTLLGKWVLIEEAEGGNVEKYDVKDEELILFFREDGICVVRETKSSGFELMEWTYENEILTVSGMDIGGVVKELTSSTLRLDGGDKFEGTTFIFTKIKDECSGSKDNRNLKTFAEAYEKAYSIKDDDRPAYQMINAKDGFIFYTSEGVVKIYEFESEKALKKEVETNPTLQSKLFVSDGRFLCESNSAELKGFFVMVPKCKVETKKEQEEEPKNDDSIVVSNDESKWKYSEETKTDPMDNTTTKMTLASLISDNSVTLWDTPTSFTLGIAYVEGNSSVFLQANSSYNIMFNAGFGGEKTYRVKFDDEAPVNIQVKSSANNKTVFFGPPANVISKLKTTDKLTIEVELLDKNSKEIITFSTKGLKWEESEQKQNIQSNEIPKDGTYSFDLFDVEYGKTTGKLNVIIKGNSVKIIYESGEVGYKKGDVVAEGTLIKYNSGFWGISNPSVDDDEDNSYLDFQNKRYCVF